MDRDDIGFVNSWASYVPAPGGFLHCCHDRIEMRVCVAGWGVGRGAGDGIFAFSGTGCARPRRAPLRLAPHPRHRSARMARRRPWARRMPRRHARRASVRTSRPHPARLGNSALRHTKRRRRCRRAQPLRDRRRTRSQWRPLCILPPAPRLLPAHMHRCAWLGRVPCSAMYAVPITSTLDSTIIVIDAARTFVRAAIASLEHTPTLHGPRFHSKPSDDLAHSMVSL